MSNMYSISGSRVQTARTRNAIAKGKQQQPSETNNDMTAQQGAKPKKEPAIGRQRPTRRTKSEGDKHGC